MARMAGEQEDDLMTTPAKKAICPMCKLNRTHKRKRAPGYYCLVCKIAFRDPLNTDTQRTEVA